MKRIMMFIGLLSLITTVSTYPCEVSLLNDSETTVLVVAEDNGEAIQINKNVTKKFGSTKKHACFYVMAKGARNTYQCNQLVRQHACSQGKSIALRISDITQYKLDKKYFTVAQYTKLKK